MTEQNRTGHLIIPLKVCLENGELSHVEIDGFTAYPNALAERPDQLFHIFYALAEALADEAEIMPDASEDE